MISKNLIIFSPGWGNNVFNLRPIENRFKSEGFDTIVVSNNPQGIKESADGLSHIIDEVRDCYDHISFIGYSMGGIVGRYVIQTAPDNYINSYISIASPHWGCKLAELASPWSKTAYELGRQSDILKELNEADWPYALPSLGIQAGFEEIVQPAESTILAYGENIMIPMTTHMSVVFSPRTFYEIYAWMCSIFFPSHFFEPPVRKGISSRVRQLL